MKLYIDSADTQQIRYLNEYYPIAGVTTNPSIIVQANRPFSELLAEIGTVIGDEKELFVQVIGNTAEEMVAETKFIRKHISSKVISKIPVTEEGLKAIRTLATEQIPTLATTIYTPFQALMAAMAGASYVAPYVNRIDNLTGNGVKVVEEIAKLFKVHKVSTEIVAASFKNVQQVYDCLTVGAGCVTVAPDLINKFISFPSTATDVALFKQQWKTLYGQDQNTIMY